MNRPIESTIIDLLVPELGILPDHAWVANQNRYIPPTDGLFLTVAMLSAVPIANDREFSWSDETSTCTAQIRGQMQIDLFSRSNEALLRWPEIILALNSDRAQQIQRERGIKLFELPFSMVNNSGPVGPDEIYRYSCTISALWSFSRTTPVQFYDRFSSTLGDEEKLERFHITFGDKQQESDVEIE